MVETFGHSQVEHKSSFGVKISGTRPPPWAWGATSVPCRLGSMHELGSCKWFKRNLNIPSKSHFLNFPNMLHRLGLCSKRIKYNIIYELDPQEGWAGLSQAYKKCNAKICIIAKLII